MELTVEYNPITKEPLRVFAMGGRGMAIWIREHVDADAREITPAQPLSSGILAEDCGALLLREHRAWECMK